MTNEIISLVTQSSIETVGVVQILKNFLPEKFPKKLLAVISPLCAIGFTVIGTYCPQVISTCIMTVCVSQLGYETILQTIQKIASKGEQS